LGIVPENKSTEGLVMKTKTTILLGLVLVIALNLLATTANANPLTLTLSSGGDSYTVTGSDVVFFVGTGARSHVGLAGRTS